MTDNTDDSKYANSKIYKLICNKNNLIYFGSTTKTLKQRLQNHVSKYKAWVNGTANYTTSFEIIKENDYCIELVENVKCKTKVQLHARESFYIKSNICVNKCIPLRTDSEYRLDNKEHIIEQQKEYNQKNKDVICNRQKEYRKNNKEHMIQQKKEYRKNNKEKLIKPYVCECDSIVQNCEKSRHFKSLKHITFVNGTVQTVLDEMISKIEFITE